MAAVPEYSAQVVNTFPHASDAFTEGFFYLDGFLYESTGQKGHSYVRKERLEIGEVLQQKTIASKYFGEGIVDWDGRLFELTWQSHIGFVYDLNSFKRVADFHYKGEGWALTRNEQRIFMSDGTSDIRLLEPKGLREIGRIHVTCDGRPVHNINELEWVKGEIYANIWLTSLIARIDPATGQIVGLIDLTELATSFVHPNPDSVLNGIAYDASGDRLFVTGKLWPKVYQITLAPAAAGTDLCSQLP